MLRRLTSGQPTARVESMDERGTPAEWHERIRVFDGPHRALPLAWLACWCVGAMPVPGLAAPVDATLPAAEPRADVATASTVPGVAIWTETTGDTGVALRAWVEECAQQVLEQRASPLGPEALIRIMVHGGPYDYRVRLELVHRDRRLDDQPQALRCECGSDEMLERLGVAIEAAAERLAAQRAAEATQAARAEPSRTMVLSDTSRGRSERHLGRLGWAGIGMSALGASALGTGIALALPPDELRIIDSMPYRRSTHPAGVALVAGGGVVLATGVVMIVVDLVRPRAAPIAIMPTVGSRWAGLSIARRF